MPEPSAPAPAHCPECGQELMCSEALARHALRCPRCGAALCSTRLSGPSTAPGVALGPWAARAVRGLIVTVCFLIGTAVPIVLSGGREFERAVSRSKYGALMGVVLGSVLA